MPIPPAAIPTFHRTDHFNLLVTHANKKSYITMSMITQITKTNMLPATHSLISLYLPSVLTSECFNDLHIPFSEEVKNTEIGHLFEHILLEYLCALKIAKGYTNVMFSGFTQWNWYKEPKGIFHITIRSKSEDLVLFTEALQKSIQLVTLILQSNTTDSSFFYSRLTH